MRALERASTFRGVSGLATWLRRIAHNLAVDRARRRREEPAEDVVEQIADIAEVSHLAAKQRPTS